MSWTNWLTPNVQKTAAVGFVFIWFLAEGRLNLFFKALSGQAVISG